jgi:transposase-like protein
MNSQKNAPLTPKGREAMVRCVEAGLSKAAAARQFNTTPKTVAKWVERFRAGRCRWFARPLLQASFIAKPNGACHVRGR